MVSAVVISLVKSLALTLIIETAGAAALGFRAKGDYLLLLLVNVATNPVVAATLDYMYYYHYRIFGWYLILALEVAAVCVEWLLYRNRLRYRKMNPFFVSLILNALSYTGGLIVDKLF